MVIFKIYNGVERQSGSLINKEILENILHVALIPKLKNSCYRNQRQLNRIVELTRASHSTTERGLTFRLSNNGR